MERVAYPAAHGGMMWRFVGLLIIAALMAALGYYAPQFARRAMTGVIVGWGAAAICVAAAISLMRKLQDPDGLIVDAQGFSYRPIWSRRSFLWTQVSPFTVYRKGAGAWISFSGGGAAGSAFSRINTSVTGHTDVIMPYHYDWPIDQVCDALNYYREQALARAS